MRFSADVEAEEIDLGYDPAGLADDVDGVEAVEDPEALDSDLEDDGMGDFGDMEEDCDGMNATQLPDQSSSLLTLS